MKKKKKKKQLFSIWLLIIEHATGWTNAMTWRPIDETKQKKNSTKKKSPGACVVAVCLFIPWLLMSLCISSVKKKNSTHTHTHTKLFRFFFFSSCWPHWNFICFLPLGVASHVITNEFNIGMDLDVKMLRRRRTLPLDRLLFYYYYFSVSFLYILCGRHISCVESLSSAGQMSTQQRNHVL